MKLIFAGISGSETLDASNYLFNCLRNKSCQRKYYVPLRSISDVSFYVDLPGKPDLIQSDILDICNLTCFETPGGDFSDDFNEDFDIGGENCIESVIPVLWGKYVVGQKPDLNWYGVFGQPNQTTINFDCFYFRYIFTVGGVDYIYYSEQFCIEKCDPLINMKGCYPNEPVGSDAFDCNGIYYGFHSGPSVSLGQNNFRYFHWANVRKGSIIDKDVKLTLNYFNNRRNYKSVLTREKLLEFELVPSFYKDSILAIFTRGNIKLNDSDYRLSAEQTWSILDTDSKLWQLDTNLFDECKQYFGCRVADCLPPAASCSDNPTDVSGVTGMVGTTFTFTGGIMNAGDSIEWMLLRQTDSSVVESSFINLPPWQFQINFSDHPDYDPATKCYLVKWRKKCESGGFSGWLTKVFGTCDPVDQPCKTYIIFLNPDSPTLATVDYIDCNGDPQTANLSQDETKYICAKEGTLTPSNGYVTITEYSDGCNLPPVCHSYTVNYMGTNEGTTLYWTDCVSGSSLSSFFTIQMSVCSRDTPTADGPVEIIDNGPC
jgi:hypothetical protein